MSDPGAYWTDAERTRLVRRFAAAARTLLPDVSVTVAVIAEPEWLREPGLAPWVGSTRGGWSVWLRETVGGAPRTWARLVETLVHELAHCTVPDGTGHTVPFRAAQRRLEQMARAGALDPAEPGDVADLFVVTADRQERSRALFQWIERERGGRCLA